MRLCCCGCCSCCESDSSVVDSTELLHSPGIGEGSQYYTVRRISSFGRAASQEDLEGSCQDLCEVSKNVANTLDDISVFTPLADKYSGVGADQRTGVTEPDSCALPPHSAAKKKPHWRKALHGLKPRPGRLRSKSPSPVPPITISSPSNVDDTSLALPQSKLRHVLTMSDVSSVGLTDHPQVFRFKSRSMQDINSSGDLHRDGKFSEEARRLARSVGLNVSLYPSEPPLHHRSAETLGPPETLRGDDRTQEHGCGRVHFFITYYPKDKKLLVNVTQLEGLPPRNDYQDYTVALKVQILPAEKPAKTARLGEQEIDEDFYFSLKDARGKAVRLSVFDADRMGKHDAIGHALVRLDAEAIRATQLYTVDLHKQSELDVMPGSIQLTIGYDSEAQRLSVLVAAASNLSTSHLSKASKQPDKLNTYVKLVHYRDGEKVKSKRSGVVPHDQHPQYNQQFLLKMPGLDVAESYVVVSVVLKGLLRDETIGRIVFGPHCYTAERTYTPWGKVMMGDKTVSDWYKLYL